MKYLSVCSGIEAATVAWHQFGWNAFAFSEIEKFPSQVIAHRYPDVPNLGDMNKFKEWPDAAIDVLVGGTPCQSFSVAGLRKGLDDPRGNLMLTYLAIADKYRPQWLVWENVPGVLSSNGGNDFASLLRGMGELGYGFAYRVLDAQYFGVAQRRRRVFVIGCLGSWQRAAAVLFERHSLQGNPAPSREKAKDVAGTITRGAFSGGAGGRPEGAAGNHFIAEIAPTINAAFGSKLGLDNQHVDGGGGCSLPQVAMCLNAGAMGRQDAETETLIPTIGGGFDVAYPINTQIATRHEALGEGTGIGIGANGEPGYTLQAAHSHAVAFGWQNSSQQGASVNEHITPTLDKSKTPAVSTRMQVRRLTPTECERLQGFPDGYTDIKSNGKPTPDGPRYKALGNSMAVPVMAWIGKRIQMVSSIRQLQEVA